jgi:hypothetical protein
MCSSERIENRLACFVKKQTCLIVSRYLMVKHISLLTLFNVSSPFLIYPYFEYLMVFKYFNSNISHFFRAIMLTNIRMHKASMCVSWGFPKSPLFVLRHRDASTDHQITAVEGDRSSPPMMWLIIWSVNHVQPDLPPSAGSYPNSQRRRLKFKGLCGFTRTMVSADRTVEAW